MINLLSSENHFYDSRFMLPIYSPAANWSGSMWHLTYNDFGKGYRSSWFLLWYPSIFSTGKMCQSLKESPGTRMILSPRRLTGMSSRWKRLKEPWFSLFTIWEPKFINQNKVEENIKFGKKIGIAATPTFFINGHIITGAPSAEKFEELIEDAFRKAVL